MKAREIDRPRVQRRNRSHDDGQQVENSRRYFRTLPGVLKPIICALTVIILICCLAASHKPLTWSQLVFFTLGASLVYISMLIELSRTRALALQRRYAAKMVFC